MPIVLTRFPTTAHRYQMLPDAGWILFDAFHREQPYSTLAAACTVADPFDLAIQQMRWQDELERFHGKIQWQETMAA